MLAGVLAITGFSLSEIVTSKLEVTTLPAPSVAVYVTVVVPMANVAPLLWVEVKTTEQLSLAVGAVQVTTPSQLEASVFCVILAGVLVITGFSLSLIVTVNELVAVLPTPSVAV